MAYVDVSFHDPLARAIALGSLGSPLTFKGARQADGSSGPQVTFYMGNDEAAARLAADLAEAINTVLAKHAVGAEQLKVAA